MKFVDEYRNGSLARTLAVKIRERSRKKVRLMEICGTHTMAIFRHGIRSLLPDRIELISGPGCPVCVTAMEDIDRAIKLALVPDLILTTFGDMMSVPGSASSLEHEKSRGADVRMVYSSFDALKIAEKHPNREVAFLGIGFETTAPTVAAAVKTGQDRNIPNFSVLSLHKLLPPAMEALLYGEKLDIDGFICPGHVTTIIGTPAYESVAEKYGIPCVIAGFEPVDILEAILMLVNEIERDAAGVQIQYVRAVRKEGNPSALKLMGEVFKPCDSSWRGLGMIPSSGLAIGDPFCDHDAGRRFDLNVQPAREPENCRCAEVLRGAIRPSDCKLFRKVCTPRNPVGACMVSSEGACAAYYKYQEV
jgi:hydrogenase expression/formation protein HypD